VMNMVLFLQQNLFSAEMSLELSDGGYGYIGGALLGKKMMAGDLRYSRWKLSRADS
jgi:hypothetical protein